MQSRVPIPTDNIYKFYALFGLLLLLACVYTFVNLHQSHNKEVFERFVEMAALNEVETPNKEQEARKVMLERQNEVAIMDKDYYMKFIFSFGFFAMFLIAFGFYFWQTKIQPQQDKIVSKQLEKIDLEIKVLNKQVNDVS